MADFNPQPAGAPDDFSTFHPALRPMRRTVDRLFDAGDYERGFPILAALVRLNDKPGFQQPASEVRE